MLGAGRVSMRPCCTNRQVSTLAWNAGLGGLAQNTEFVWTTQDQAGRQKTGISTRVALQPLESADVKWRGDRCADGGRMLAERRRGHLLLKSWCNRARQELNILQSCQASVQAGVIKHVSLIRYVCVDGGREGSPTELVIGALHPVLASDLLLCNSLLVVSLSNLTTFWGTRLSWQKL